MSARDDPDNVELAAGELTPRQEGEATDCVLVPEELMQRIRAFLEQAAEEFDEPEIDELLEDVREFAC